MKKLAIAGASAAALGLAVLPMAGVFADVTDTVQITISDACTVGSTSASEGTANATFSASLANGGVKEWAAASGTGGDLYISCNSSTGWNVKAQGFSNDTAGTTTMVATGNGTAIATGTTLDGSVSNWAFMVADDNTGATISTSDYTAVPGTATRVAYKSGTVSEGHLYTGYKVGVSSTQEADTYTGKVKYTISAGVGQ